MFGTCPKRNTRLIYFTPYNVQGDEASQWTRRPCSSTAPVLQGILGLYIQHHTDCTISQIKPRCILLLAACSARASAMWPSAACARPAQQERICIYSSIYGTVKRNEKIKCVKPFLLLLLCVNTECGFKSSIGSWLGPPAPKVLGSDGNDKHLETLDMTRSLC